MIRNKIFNICKSYTCNNRLYSTMGKPVDLVFNIQKPSTTTSINNSVNNKIKNIIILHGLFGAGGNWRTVSPKLADLTQCNIIQVDQRNHGTSPHSDEFNYKLLSDDLDQLIKKQSFDKDNGLAIIGHSLGGRVAMLYSLLNPNKVNKLVIVDISPSELKNGTILEFREYLIRMNSMDLNSIKNRKDAEDWLEPIVKDKGVRLFLLTNLILGENGRYQWRNNISGLLKNIENVSSFPTENEILKYKNQNSSNDTINSNKVEFTNETLFIAGGKSKFIQERDLPKISQFFPKYHLEIVPDIGHWIHAEDPKTFIRLTSDFINNH